MKTTFNFIISSLICITLISSNHITPQSTKGLLLQATDTNVSSEILTQSARIINNRLKTYGLETNVLVIYHKAQIVVELPDKIDKPEFEKLLTTKGSLGFYEILTLNEIAEFLKNKNHQLRNEPKTSPSDARIGCSSFEDQKMVDSIKNYIDKVNLTSAYKLFWGIKDNRSLTCLYALKTNNIGGSSFGRSDIETINSIQDKNSQTFNIEIKFKPESAKKWAITTKNNLDKPIAIAIDDIVFYTPVVKTAMENGLCEITGNLNQKEVNYFLAIVNHEPLPTNFIVR